MERYPKAVFTPTIHPLSPRSYYYATINLGTPPRPFTVIIDTGSTITYVPCSQCQQKCGK